MSQALGGINTHKALRCLCGTRGIGGRHTFKKRLRLGLKPVGAARTGQALGGYGHGQIEPQRDIGFAQALGCGRQAGLHHVLQGAQHGQVKTAPTALVGKSGIGKAVTQHHLATRQCGGNHLHQVVAPRGKHQQRLAQGIHAVVQQQGAQLLGQRRAAGLARAQHLAALGREGLGQGVDVRAFARTIHAFKADEKSGAGVGAVAHFCPRW